MNAIPSLKYSRYSRHSTHSYKIFLFNLEFLAIFLMLFNTSTIYASYFPLIADSLLIIGSFLVCVIALLSNEGFLQKKSLIPFSLFFFYIFVCGALTNLSSSLIFLLLKIFLCCVIVSIADLNNINFFKIFYKYVFIMSLWSLINYFLSYFNFFNLPITNVFITEWGGNYNLHLFIFFKNVMGFNFGDFTLYRMHAPFSEPGVAQLFFNFGLFYNLFKENNNIKNRILLILFFGICVILSFSFTGYIVCFLIFFIYLLRQRKFLHLFCFALISSIIILIFGLNKLNSGSFFERSNDLLFLYNLFVDNLPFGIGLSENANIDFAVIDEQGLKVAGGFYSGIFTPLIYFGLIGMLYYLFLVNALKYSFKNKFSKAAFSCLLIFTLTTEPLTFTTLFCLFIANGLLMRSRIIK